MPLPLMLKNLKLISSTFKSERLYQKECAAEREQLKHELMNWIANVW